MYPRISSKKGCSKLGLITSFDGNIIKIKFFPLKLYTIRFSVLCELDKFVLSVA
jgi:hypothetical protein